MKKLTLFAILASLPCQGKNVSVCCGGDLQTAITSVAGGPDIVTEPRNRNDAAWPTNVIADSSLPGAGADTSFPMKMEAATRVRQRPLSSSTPPMPQATAPQAVISYTLINADTNQPMAGYDPLPPGTTLDLVTLPTQHLNMRVNTSPSQVGSVQITVDGTTRHTENILPYSVFNDNNGVYASWTPTLGLHTVLATPFTGMNLSGTIGASLTLSFNVINTASTLSHYEYVIPDGSLSVFDADNNWNLVKTVPLNTTNVKGSVASAATGMLYISYGSTGSSGGQILEYNLYTDKVVWSKTYNFGIDSMALSPDGKTLYMPAPQTSLWEVIDAASGNVTGTINSGGVLPHNTIVTNSGAHVYLGPQGTRYLVEADASTHQILKQIGPVNGSTGVRPFTIDSKETFAFITTTNFLGFQVADINSGRILYTVQIGGFSDNSSAPAACSHGISLSPDEKEIYVMDSANSYIHVFDVTPLPGAPPRQVADIKLDRPMANEGWLHHSRDGRYVYVGDNGDVLDTQLRKPVAYLPALNTTRKMIEIDFKNGEVTWAMNNRSSLGVVLPNRDVSGAPTPPGVQAVISYTLINADTNQPVPGYDPLSPGMTIDLVTLPTRHLNMRVNTSPSQVGSVQITVDGTTTHTENILPYSVFNDNNGIYASWTPTAGSHAVLATPFAGPNLTGTEGASLTLIFNVID